MLSPLAPFFPIVPKLPEVRADKISTSKTLWLGRLSLPDLRWCFLARRPCAYLQQAFHQGRHFYALRVTEPSFAADGSYPRGAMHRVSRPLGAITINAYAPLMSACGVADAVRCHLRAE
jgi:hypothetical protein